VVFGDLPGLSRAVLSALNLLNQLAERDAVGTVPFCTRLDDSPIEKRVIPDMRAALQTFPTAPRQLDQYLEPIRTGPPGAGRGASATLVLRGRDAAGGVRASRLVVREQDRVDRGLDIGAGLAREQFGQLLLGLVPLPIVAPRRPDRSPGPPLGARGGGTIG
jgi:hypothetical protein